MRCSAVPLLGAFTWTWLQAGGAKMVHVCDAESHVEQKGTCAFAHSMQLQQGSLNVMDRRPKIRQKGGSGRSNRHRDEGAEDPDPWAQDYPHEKLTCGASGFAPFNYDCPKDCNILAPHPTTGCHWTCEKSCNAHSDFSVLDDDALRCRKCEVAGCAACVTGEDTCVACAPLYVMTDSGCKFRFRYVVWTLEAISLLIVACIAVWYVCLLCSPEVNPEGLEQALAYRKQCSFRGEGGKLLPLSTDFRAVPCNGESPIGGPGLMLHFNFQFALLMWILLALCGWVIVGFVSDWQIFSLGTVFVEDPVDMCRAVHWGAGMRALLREYKLGYTVALYVASTLAALALAVRQNRRLAQVKSTSPMMTDYAALCTGFPQECGHHVDADIADFVYQSTGHKPEGVSVAWDFHDKRAQVYALLSSDIRELEFQYEAKDGATSTKIMSRGIHDASGIIGQQKAVSSRLSLFKQAAAIFGDTFGDLLERFMRTVDGVAVQRAQLDTATNSETVKTRAPQNPKKGHRGFWARTMCEEMVSSGTVIVVFSSVHARDEAVASLNKPEAMRYKDMHTICAKIEEDWDADGVVWDNFTVTHRDRIMRLATAILASAVMMMLWGICLYAPWAYFQATTYAQQGRSPPSDHELIFSTLVLCGSQLVYLLSSLIAEYMRYPYKDSTQAAYVRIYTIFLLLNTVFDIGLVGYTTYLSMVMRDVRTNDGMKLTDLPDSAAVVTSYPMMKVFGRTLWEYNFPACFLYAFIGEAIFTVALPLHLGKQVVSSRLCSREHAECYLQPLPMDLARYADLVANSTLAAFAMMTTSGWILRTLLGLLLGNLFIYAFDHYRILRHVDSFHLTSHSIDAAACGLLMIPCAVLGACIVVQLHEAGLLQWNLFLCVLGGFVLHIVVHSLALAGVLGCFGAQGSGRERDVPYKEVEEKLPYNWFNTNPMHCLRTQYMYDGGEPCVYYVKGKEALIHHSRKVARMEGASYMEGDHGIASAPHLKGGHLTVPGWD